MPRIRDERALLVERYPQPVEQRIQRASQPVEAVHRWRFGDAAAIVVGTERLGVRTHPVHRTQRGPGYEPCAERDQREQYRSRDEQDTRQLVCGVSDSVEIVSDDDLPSAVRSGQRLRQYPEGIPVITGRPDRAHRGRMQLLLRTQGRAGQYCRLSLDKVSRRAVNRGDRAELRDGPPPDGRRASRFVGKTATSDIGCCGIGAAGQAVIYVGQQTTFEEERKQGDAASGEHYRGGEVGRG